MISLSRMFASLSLVLVGWGTPSEEEDEGGQKREVRKERWRERRWRERGRERGEEREDGGLADVPGVKTSHKTKT